MIAIVVAAELRRAPARVPLGGDPAQGGGDEPALGGRRLRRRDRRLPGGLGRRRSSASPHAIPIVSFVPLLMFAILFGLSMDYEVFLVTQMQEHYLESGDAKEAVVDGLAATGRVITSAALDHGLRLRELRPQRRPDRQGVRRRPGGRDRHRRDRRPLPARARRDGAARRAQLVDAARGSTASCRGSASRGRGSSTTSRVNRPPPLRRMFCQTAPRRRRLPTRPRQRSQSR